ncbi:LpqB family beta-propeller domain-containing protein [Blastococcus goldschmidtiae]|uniref:LpqB family beta-propeller domain-containing protein n=1 Tax=Blastococcus goldschmidtiae TaxID=3075546 RepID=A0ABU2K4L4_9ACTN|nr:LpqB family beta-propeller domain-containing protein [Blastococcus sp. DSM 46792]MDT0275151.1 LpqB family beta-propeller domain-containing protein [Blastococcus sp. DSM 46792]
MTRRAGAPALVAALVLGLTSCSIVPTSSPTVPITQAPARPVQDVGVPALPPARDATPEEVVRGFIDAAASSAPGRPVAKEYLTPEAAAAWSDAGAITIISSGYATVASESGSVEVTAGRVGTIDERGIFTVAGTDVFSYDFPLVEVDGEWRISDPPDGLVILETDFQRLFDPVEAYFLDPTMQRLVPDPRYLIGGEAQPTALVNRLIEGPSAALALGVRNPLAGARLARTVVVEDQVARVDLTGLDIDANTPLRELSAQLVWSLTGLDGQRIRSVVITLDGEPLPLDDVPVEQTTDDWPAFDPDATPLETVGHYLDDGALHTADDGAPAPGPAGTGRYGLASAAVSADVRNGELTFLAGVRPEPGGATLLAGPYGGELAPVLSGATLSAPTVAATRPEVWVVRDGTDVVRVPAGGTPQAVSAPTLAGLGRAEVIELSPDGTRLAVVVDGPLGRRLHVGTVVRSEEGGVAIRDLPGVAPTLSPVVDVAWRSNGQLWVLAGDPGEETPYSLGVDGWGLAALGTSGLPDEPTSLGAAPGRDPLVVAGNRLWQWSRGTWRTLLRGQEPLTGSAPFYPL